MDYNDLTVTSLEWLARGIIPNGTILAYLIYSSFSSVNRILMLVQNTQAAPVSMFQYHD